MSRRRVAAKRKILADPKYHNEMLAKFINHLMLDGKKSTAEKIVYQALEAVAAKHSSRAKADDEDGGGEEGSGTGSKSLAQLSLELLEQALDKVRPKVEVRPRRVGGATYQVPMEVRENRRDALAMRWLINCARKRGEKGMDSRLAGELTDALAGRGAAVKKREEMHKMAEANKAFAHFRWN